ncbi:Hypp6447 [Branchiostoma lanceolatum]|uniref:Hypp6447 protein n=1 Tax=Branchiostoma lanceolatum TaxID=7740 RepID=A0A8J9YUJ1_BRALA|nr:Hypp6447 [Branchiostoma lanceolatum]
MASSSLGFKHVNRGPLKLDHDITPKDFNAFTPPPATEAPRRTYKYQGFPDKQFEGVKEPLTGPLRLREKEAPPPKRKKVQATQFVNGKPIFELDGKNFQYGTDELHHLLESSDKIPLRRSDFLKDQRGSAEERRRHKQQNEAEQDIARWRTEKARKKVEEVEEKKKDLEMLKTYQPFGRPGGGAPKPGTKKESPPITDNRMAPMNRMTNSLETRFKPPMPEHTYEDGFGKPGGGAPFRTESGKIKTTYKMDASLWFKANNKAAERELETIERYKLDPQTAKEYKTELARLMDDKKQKMQQEYQADMEADKKMADFNPFGKPGAGAPLRDYHGQLKLKREQHLARMDDLYEQRKVAEKEKIRKEQRQKLLDQLIHDEDPYKPRLVDKVDRSEGGGAEYDPWGKGQGAPMYDKSGNIRRFKRTDLYGVPETYRSDVKGGTLDLKPTGGGGPLLDDSGKVKPKVKKTMVYENGACITEEYVAKATSAEIRRESDRDWWGKPGGGAPVVNENGQIIRSTRGKLLTDATGGEVIVRPVSDTSKTVLANSKKSYFEDLKVAVKEEKEKKQRERRELREAGGDVAQWMKESQTGKPKRDPVTGQLMGANRIMSDVTKQQMDVRNERGQGSQALYNDLVAQAEQRRQQRMDDRKREIEMERKHQMTMDNSWGREGGGAPLSQQQGGTRRSNRGQPEITPLGQIGCRVPSFSLFGHKLVETGELWAGAPPKQISRSNPTQLQPPFATSM